MYYSDDITTKEAFRAFSKNFCLAMAEINKPFPYDPSTPFNPYNAMFKRYFFSYARAVYVQGLGANILPSTVMNEVTHGSDAIANTYSAALKVPELRAVHIVNSPILTKLESVKGVEGLKIAAHKFVALASDVD